MKIKWMFYAITTLILCWDGVYFAQAAESPVSVSAPQPAIPPNIASAAPKPMMMLASSKDHTLFSPMYTDYEDIDGDGVLDTTFKPSFKYYGYFDEAKCYVYDDLSSRFDPDSMAIQTMDGRYTCTESKSLWSGNFLNWASMSRVDVIRKMLYGGKRSTDEVPSKIGSMTTTVLERANLSQDAHSFVKHYWGTDIRDYTPFTTMALTKITGSNAGMYAGLTLCSRSDVMGEQGNPVIRLAKGNYRMWGSVDGVVCEWDQGNLGRKLARYFKDSDKGNGGISHEEIVANRTLDGAIYDGIGPDLTVRVRVCVPSLLGEERCQAFPADASYNYKPYGLFQEFGLGRSVNNAARAEFGVITGSYDKNLTAGALRKNMGDFSDEINAANGVFCHNPGSGCSSTSDGRVMGNGAIKAMDAFLLYGRGSGTYAGSNNQLPAEMSDGTLSAWGNPVGEMVVQALQYFAAKSATNPTETTQDTSKGLPVVPWLDPLSMENKERTGMYGNPICRPMYTLVLSSSALSFDSKSAAPFSTLPNRSGDLHSYVNRIGVEENIAGTARSVGSVDGGYGQSCSKKTVGQLSAVSGICPEAPALGGTYQVAGAALYANTSQIRHVATPPADLKYVQDALKVKTMAASLGGGVARIEVPIPGTSPRKFVYITPESLWNSGDIKTMPGAMLDFQSISSGDRYGAFVVVWNNALFGGNYDMDIVGFIRYDINDDTASPSKYSITITTDIINAGTGFTGAHGFSVMGTEGDGRYLTHRHLTAEKMLKGAEGYLCEGMGITGNSAYNVSTDSSNVRDADYPIRKAFKMLGVNGVLLQDPLWYAAKYGYFTSSKKNADGTYTNINMPESREAWDNLKSDGSAGADGVPDGYFLARRPEILEQQLRKALNVIAHASNAAVAISTTVLTEGALKYAVRFDSTTVTGQLEAYKLLANGEFATTPHWEAGSLLHAKASPHQGRTREIITNDGPTGVPFRWGSLSPAYQVQMTTASTNQLTAANAQVALDYIRGDQRQESAHGLRQRGKSLLGPVVNSSPWVQRRPMASWGGTVTGYGAFYHAHRERKGLLWLGANDGMLHAFNAESGEEVLAYVPGALANRLAEIPLQRGGKTRLNGVDFVSGVQVQPPGAVWPYVDGNAYSADVKVGGNWRTYVFGALGRGGRGVFALDATTLGSLREDQAASIFQWQFTAADDSDLGYQTGDVKIHQTSNQASPIALLNNGKFAMILGNGQRSVSGKAVLYILYMDGPSGGNWSGRYKKIVVDAGRENGLSTPRWEDIDGNGTADHVYAGDLKGNVWKFDLTSEDAGKWAPAFGAQATADKMATPLFTATTTDGQRTVAQPITTAPELVYMASGGMLVHVATGNAFVHGDFGASTVRQSIYGVWDKGVALTAPTLLRRSYTRLASGAVVSSTPAAMDWSKYSGWAIDLPMGGEAVLTDPSYDAGVLSFVSTRPKTEAYGCNSMPGTTLYTVDPIAGQPERSTQGYDLVNGIQVLVAGKDIGDPKVRMVSNRRPPPKVACKAGEPGCSCQGADCSKEVPVCGPGQRSLSAIGRGADAAICYSTAPRLQWREIPGLRTYP